MTRDQIESLIPHAGPMCLLETADDWDADHIVCRSASHRDPAHPLRRRGGRLRSVHLVEYAAQAAALHDRLASAGGDGGKGGMLVEVRDIHLGVTDVGGVSAELTVIARAELRSAAGLIYSFRVEAGEQWLADGRLTIATG